MFPFTVVGVDAIRIFFLCPNERVRTMKSFNVSVSRSFASLHLSISSQNRYRTGRDAAFAGD